MLLTEPSVTVRLIRLNVGCNLSSQNMPTHMGVFPRWMSLLDTFSEKRGRGRPRNCRYSEILGRAENYREIFGGIWDKLSGPLLAARTEDEVTQAFRSYGEPYAHEFVPRLARDILVVMGKRKFPKRAKPQIKFLANSLAGRPNVEARTSRDICAKGLAEEKAKSQHTIVCKEFYVECTCGFKGPALDNACRKCGAQISFLPDLIGGFRQF